MARPLRIEFPGAIYHVMSRGNARQTVFRDDSDYQRLIKGLETVVGRLGWDLLCFVLMPNHFHLLVRTPRPNLSRGMQHLTSGYANWCSRRHRRPGHTFQGRFKSELIEDESYYPGTEELIRTRRASEGSASEPSLARRVSTCKDAKLSYRGNTSGPSAATSSSIPCGANARSPITRATGPGRAIRATTAGGGALDGWPTRLCIRPGVASRAATIPRRPTGGSSSRDWRGLRQTPFSPRRMAGCWAARRSSSGCDRC